MLAYKAYDEGLKTMSAMMEDGWKRWAAYTADGGWRAGLSPVGMWPWRVEWKETTVHYPELKLEFDEAGFTRKMFDMAAETHRRSWEIAANMITAGPDLHGFTPFDPMKAMSMVLGGSFFAGPGVDLEDAAQEASEKAAAKSKPVLKAVAAEPPPVAAPVADIAETAKPRFLSEPMGAPDDLTRIKGIGEKLNEVLHRLGVYHFWQIAGWTEENAAWVNDHLQFKGRIQREDWIEQAKALSTAGAAE